MVLFFLFPYMNSFELQENTLDTFNELVGLISPTKGLQEKHLIWKWEMLKTGNSSL